MNVLLTVLTLLLVVVPSLILTVILSVVAAAKRKRGSIGCIDEPSAGLKIVSLILLASSFLMYTIAFFVRGGNFDMTAAFGWMLAVAPMILMFLHFIIFHGKKPSSLPAIALLCFSIFDFRSAIVTYNNLKMYSSIAANFFSLFLPLLCGCIMLMASLPMLISGSKRRGRVLALIVLFFNLLTYFVNICTYISMSSRSYISNSLKEIYMCNIFIALAFFALHLIMVIYLFGKTKTATVVQPPYVPVQEPVYQPVQQPVQPVYQQPVQPVYQQPVQPQVPAFCPHCGNPRTPDQAFCQYCGGRLD